MSSGPPTLGYSLAVPTVDPIGVTAIATALISVGLCAIVNSMWRFGHPVFLMVWGASGLIAVISGTVGVHPIRNRYRGRSLSYIALGICSVEAVACLTLLAISFAKPSSEEILERYRCSTQMRSIGNALILYANEHDGRYPASLDNLVAGGYLPATSLICPRSSRVGSRMNYLYFVADRHYPTDSQTPLVSEPLSNHDRGINVLLGDGTVRFVEGTDAIRLLAEHGWRQ